MERLIDADEALLRNDKMKNRSDVFRSYAKVVIDGTPTIDAVPVVHGHWISLDKCSNAGVYCSVCHKKVWKEDYAWCNRKNKLRSNYCPNCGAKMDGSADNEID